MNNPATAVTLKTVARESGYSLATVGYILRQKNLERFPEKTRRHVQAVAARLNYKPSVAARSMRKRDSGCIAMLIRHETKETHPANLPGVEYMLGIQHALSAQGRHLILVTVAELGQNLQEETPLIFRENIVDGLIVEFGVPSHVRAIIRKSGIPVVWLDTDKQTARNCIFPDEPHNVALAFDHLVANGYKHITYTGTTLKESDHPSAAARLAAFHASASAHTQATRSARCEVLLRGDEPDTQALLSCLHDYMKRGHSRSSVLLTYDLQYAYYAILTAAKLGLRTPDEMAVFSLDNARMLQGAWPFISAINLDRHRMGHTAVEMLLQLVANPARQLTSRIVRGSIFPGESCVSQI
ncbi:LacI family DNA-binding transcriptional regulator [Geminisphaera colitermitum]|uniref:LacI family DNA-binding transcriptional regulator n=1 Tax=Geminisphaera colitermitum TaxID=1148786 RepID=UPI0001965570|nr:LacI family DNA-binding transcriptional regulator [Geminisphaera colitermitum]